MTATVEIPLPNTTIPEVTPARRHWTTSRTLDEFDALEAAWTTCPAAASNPMRSFSWLRSAIASLAQERKIQVIALCDGARLLAAAPLIRAQAGRWELLNHYKLYEPADLVYADAAALAELTGELARRGLPLFLGRLPADSPTVAAIQRAYGRRGRVVVRPQAGFPYIPLDAAWSAPEGRLSSRRRGDFRRARRHAEEQGEVAGEIVAPSSRDVDELLDVVFEIEGLSWKGAQGTALARDAARAAFYRRFARRAARDGSLRLGFLRIGGNVAAVQISVVQADALWVLKIGYDPRFHRASPGILLMVEQIKDAVAAGLSRYELLGTVEPWIQVWTEHQRACVSLRAYPANLRGAATLAREAAAMGYRRLLGRAACER
ncbi:MAG TPA: GNAT family N-acetyltransferase [Pirellulales bacterium]|nr:GNAT family N-acetyltransferase [Pirellulales bacterium]